MTIELVDAPDGVFAAKIGGNLNVSEMRQLQQSAASFIEKHGKAKFLIIAEDFKGFDRGDWSDTSFQSQFDRQIEKIAIVGEKKWEDLVSMFMGKGLRRVDIEFFAPSDLAKAKEWLTPGGADCARAASGAKTK
jgi:hypothetical protein